MNTRAGKRSGALLWAVLLLVLLGAGGAGAYLAFFAGDTSDARESEGSFDMGAWEDDVRAAPPEHESPPAVDDAPLDVAPEEIAEAAELLRELREAEALGEEMDEVVNASAAGSDSHRRDQVYEDSAFPYSMVELALQIRLSMLELETTSADWRGQGERRHLRGALLSLADQQKGDFLLKRRGSVFYFAAIGGPPAAYRNTKTFRQAFLNRGFRTR